MGTEQKFELTQAEAFLILERAICKKHFGSGSFNTRTTSHITATVQGKLESVSDVTFTVAVSPTQED